jgi:enterochelin esterase family protein
MLLAVIRKRSMPVIEGMTVHFFHINDNGNEVSIIGDWNRWKKGIDVMKPIRKGSEILHFEREFPIDARMSYRFAHDNTSFNDPHNPHTVTEVFGTNTFFTMPGYEGIPYEGVEVEKNGKIVELEIRGDRNIASRKVFVHIPYRMRISGTKRFLYVLDGAEAMSVGKMPQILDAMFEARPTLERIITVFIPPVDRHDEYLMNPKFGEWMSKCVRQVERKLNVKSAPDKRTIQGASLGGLAALTIGLKHYKLFRNIAAQSPSLWVDDKAIIHRFAKSRKLPLVIYLHTGTINDALDESLELLTVLQRKGYDVTYRESNESHTWANWRSKYAEIIRRAATN